MSLFRKISRDLAPMFKKLPSDVNVIGRKMSNTSEKIGSSLEKLSDKLDRQSQSNPLVKLAKSGVDAASDINRGVGVGGQGLRAASNREFNKASQLFLDAGEDLGSGLGRAAATGATALAFL